MDVGEKKNRWRVTTVREVINGPTLTEVSETKKLDSSNTVWENAFASQDADEPLDIPRFSLCSDCFGFALK